MKIEEMERLCAEAFSTLQPESHWQWVQKLVVVAKEAKRLCWALIGDTDSAAALVKAIAILEADE